MRSLQVKLRATLQEAERLAAQVKSLPRESPEGKDAIRRWAALSDEARRLMMQAEETLSPAQLIRLRAEIGDHSRTGANGWACREIDMFLINPD